MNNRQRQIYKVARKRIRAEHNAMMEKLFAYIDEVFAELNDEMEDKRTE